MVMVDILRSHVSAGTISRRCSSNRRFNVKSSLFSTEGNVLEKNDQTPVTVADFGVQALISLEFRPLVAEEDSAFVLDAVTDKASSYCKPLAQDDVLAAIDRGGKDAFVFGSKPATYWLLDGTRGFLKGSKALYVVGLALVVEGEIVISVMGCPNWQEDLSEKSSKELKERSDALPGSGTIMVAHLGCGTWTKRLNSNPKSSAWTRRFVDGFDIVH